MSIALLLEMAASAYDDRVALGHGTGAMSYADLAALAARGASVLQDAGAAHVVFVGVNSPAVPVTLFAATCAGLPFTPLNYRLSPQLLAALVAQLPTPFVVTDEPLSGLPAGVPVLSTRAWLDRCETARAADPVAADDESAAVVLFTSGTTSAPKGVVLRHANLLSYVLQTVEFASADPHDAALVCVPPYHVAGMGTILTNLYSGRRIVYLPNFTAEGWLDLVRDEQVTSAMVVPTMLARIVEQVGDTAPEVPSLRSIAYGGARMPRPVLEKALRAFRGVGFTNAYGLTETSSTIAVLGPEDHVAAVESEDPAVRGRLDSAGRFVPGVEGEVRGDDGLAVATGEPGDLWVRGPQVSGEYLGTGSVLDAGGWFPTRDRARIDADGYVYIEGRVDDTIIRGGENIAPAEIEDVLLRHPAVQECAVVGVPDDEWGERIVAVVVTDRPEAADPAELVAHVRTAMRSSRTPDEVVFRTSLPYTPTGKLLRRDLVAALIERVPAPAGA